MKFGHIILQCDIIFLLGLSTIFLLANSLTVEQSIRPTLEVFTQQRNVFIADENKRMLGAELVLSKDEEIVNNYIMKLKKKELARGFNNSAEFIPAKHFFEALDKFERSELFQFIRKLPKGGVLHAHSSALGSTSLIINLTYIDNLWQRGQFQGRVQFKFARNQPGSDWKKVAELRNSMGEIAYNTKLAELFSLYNADPINTYKSINFVWRKFESIFTTLKPIITYEPVFKKYYYDSLQQFYDDRVYYLEFRSGLPSVYNLDGKQFGTEEVVKMYIEQTEEFKKQHPNFLGAKMIFAKHRFANDTLLEKYLTIAQFLHEKFPDFVTGFDLVGQEDTGRPLIQFAPQLLKLPSSIQFFFHAGETNWYGMKTDENLVDAILLGTKRIGHGFALLKHPALLQELKRRDICVEINPISNQVLKLVEDYRNHPSVVFFSDNYPVVVASDDPSFWRATPLSHDFYLAFVGIASAHHDLRLMKKLAFNSIRYSSMGTTEKSKVNAEWENIWNESMKQLASTIDATKS